MKKIILISIGIVYFFIFNSYAQAEVSPPFDGACSVHAADMDGDGDMDVLGAAYLADDITWWENTDGRRTA